MLNVRLACTHRFNQVVQWRMPDFVQTALRDVRDPSHLSWSVVFVLGVVFYIYNVEIERKNWGAVLAGFAFWSADWINEVINCLILRGTGVLSVSKLLIRIIAYELFCTYCRRWR